MADVNDSHLSNSGRNNNETPPIPQRKRAAMGEKITGMSNPYGAAKGPTDNRIKNNQGKTY